MSTYYSAVCEKAIPDYSLQEQCIEEIDYTAFNQQLNTQLEEVMSVRHSDNS